MTGKLRRLMLLSGSATLLVITAIGAPNRAHGDEPDRVPYSEDVVATCNGTTTSERERPRARRLWSKTVSARFRDLMDPQPGLGQRPFQGACPLGCAGRLWCPHAKS